MHSGGSRANDGLRRRGEGFSGKGIANTNKSGGVTGDEALVWEMSEVGGGGAGEVIKTTSL